MELISLIAISMLLITAMVFSPLGLGGGVLYVPIFHYLLDWTVEEALLGSLTLVFMVAIGSSLSHTQSGFADPVTARIGRVTAIPGALLGTVIAYLIIEYIGDIVIKILAAIILVFVIERTIGQIRKDTNGGMEEVDVADRLIKYRFGALFAGITSGLLGIGGGAVLVTLNRSMLGMNPHKAAGTSYLVGVTLVPVALLAHFFLDGTSDIIIERVGWTALAVVPALAFISAFLGAKFTIKYIHRRFVTMAFIGAVSLSVIRYLLDFTGIL